MNKKINVFSLICMLFGFMIVVIALFASILGIDQNPGWSRPRFFLLVLGLMLLLTGFLYHRNENRVNLILKKLDQDLPLSVVSFPLIIFVLLFYVWFATSGGQLNQEDTTDYYHQQASGFLNGHLHLPLKVVPELLSLSNPYDPDQRRYVNFPADVSLYNGKYYLYWGPVPAIMLSAVYIFGVGEITDLWVALFFVCGIFILQILLLLFVWRRYYNLLPKWTFYLSIPLVGFGMPLALLRHNYEPAKIYEASISGAQFFFLCGLVTLFLIITRFSIQNWGLFLFGLFGLLAIGTRQTFLFPVGGVMLLFVVCFYKIHRISMESMGRLFYLFLPFVLGFAGLGWYNWARFGSVVEFGASYQLASNDLVANNDNLFSPLYIPQNLYNYFFMKWDLTSEFPFLFMSKGTESLPFLNYFPPEFYNAQPIVGLFYLFPFSIYILLLFSKADSKIGLDEKIRSCFLMNSWKQITLFLTISIVSSFIVLMTFFWSAIRYFGDFLPAFMMLSLIGFWQGFHFLKLNNSNIGKYLYVGLGCAIAAASIIFGILLSISTNSKLIHGLIKAFPFLG